MACSKHKIYLKNLMLFVLNVNIFIKQSGKKNNLPTKFSKTLLLPALWLPTTAIWGKSRDKGIPSEANTSCNLFTIGINCSIPTFPDILLVRLALSSSQYMWDGGKSTDDVSDWLYYPIKHHKQTTEFLSKKDKSHIKVIHKTRLQ